MTTLAEVRVCAFALPEVSEEPHHDLMSWRVRGKIFATIPNEPDRLRLFVDEDDVRATIAADPAAYEELWWGKRLAGLLVKLDAADVDEVTELVESAWRRKAPAALVKQYDAARG